jgi:ATP-binding cassette, subfamily B (MDR/TAP), member 1
MTHNDRDDDVLSPEKLNNPSHLIDDAAGPSPSFFLLFSLLTRRQTLFLLVPAIVLSIAAGGIAPFMTFVVGQAFDVFSEYSSIQHPSQDDKGRLLHGIAISVIELVALAAGALVLGSITSGLWIWTGEWHVKTLRKRVYTAVTRKDMVWFDTKMGTEGAKSGDDGPIGPGGMMSKFSR